MSKGSALSFDVIFSIGLIIIMFIAAAIVIHMVVPYLGSNVACIDGQKSQIIEINDTINEIKFSGITQIMKFKVESCVSCMWYDDVSYQLKVKWVGQAVGDEPQSFGMILVWNNFGKKPSDGKTCSDEQIKGGESCTLEITPNVVNVVS